MTAAAQTDAPACPKCGGEMWDNRADNAAKHDGRRRPDFRCKDRDTCEGVIWPPRNRPAPKAAVAAPSAPVEPLPPPTPEEQGRRLKKILTMHTLIVKHVVTSEAPLLVEAKVGDSPEAVSTRVNTLFIEACKQGLYR